MPPSTSPSLLNSATSQYPTPLSRIIAIQTRNNCNAERLWIRLRTDLSHCRICDKRAGTRPSSPLGEVVNGGPTTGIDDSGSAGGFHTRSVASPECIQYATPPPYLRTFDS